MATTSPTAPTGQAEPAPVPVDAPAPLTGDGSPAKNQGPDRGTKRSRAPEGAPARDGGGRRRGAQHGDAAEAGRPRAPSVGGNDPEAEAEAGAAAGGPAAADSEAVSLEALDSMQGGVAGVPALSDTVGVAPALRWEGQKVQLAVRVNARQLAHMLKAAASFVNTLSMEVTAPVAGVSAAGSLSIQMLSPDQVVYLSMSLSVEALLMLPGGETRAVLTPHLKELQAVVDGAGADPRLPLEMYMLRGEDPNLYARVKGKATGSTRSCVIPQEVPKEVNTLPDTSYEMALELPVEEVRGFLRSHNRDVVRLRVLCTEADPTRTGARIFVHLHFESDGGTAQDLIMEVNPNAADAVGVEASTGHAEDAVMLRPVHGDEGGEEEIMPAMLERLTRLYDQSFSMAIMTKCVSACAKEPSVLLSLSRSTPELPVCWQYGHGHDFHMAVFVAPRMEDDL